MPRPADPSPRVPLLVGLLATMLVVALLLAIEAHRATRFHRDTAARALRDYASFAAWEFLGSTKETLRRTVTDALGPVTGGRSASPYDRLPAPQSLAESARDVLRCETPGADSPRFYFRVDLRDGTLSAVDDRGNEPPPALRQWVQDTVLAHARVEYRPDDRYAVIFGPSGAQRPAIVYGLRYAQVGAIADRGAPIAAYGFTSCPAAFGVPLFRRVMAQYELLPSSVTGGASNDSLLAVSVSDDGGREIYRSSADLAAVPPDGIATERFSGVTVRVGLRPAVVERLVLGRPPRSRLPVLVGLFAIIVGLVVALVMQLRREQELARMRATFASGVSHELRTPLAQILLFGETLALGRVQSDRERQLAAETIVQEAQRLIALVENVLHFARAERGTERLEPAPVRVAPLVETALAALPPLDNGTPTFRTALDPSAVALADAGALRQVVLNLVDNARKYGPAHGAITIGAARAPSGVRLWVEDEGDGVPEHDRERVWDPFVRLRHHAGAAGGSGLGLAVVRELIRLQNGRAWIERGERGGARFVVELPAAKDGQG